MKIRSKIIWNIRFERCDENVDVNIDWDKIKNGEKMKKK